MPLNRFSRTRRHSTVLKALGSGCLTTTFWPQRHQHSLSLFLPLWPPNTIAAHVGRSLSLTGVFHSINPNNSLRSEEAAASCSNRQLSRWALPTRKSLLYSRQSDKTRTRIMKEWRINEITMKNFLMKNWVMPLEARNEIQRNRNPGHFLRKHNQEAFTTSTAYYVELHGIVL